MRKGREEEVSPNNKKGRGVDRYPPATRSKRKGNDKGHVNVNEMYMSIATTITILFAVTTAKLGTRTK